MFLVIFTAEKITETAYKRYYISCKTSVADPDPEDPEIFGADPDPEKDRMRILKRAKYRSKSSKNNTWLKMC